MKNTFPKIGNILQKIKQLAKGSEVFLLHEIRKVVKVCFATDEQDMLCGCVYPSLRCCYAPLVLSSHMSITNKYSAHPLSKALY